MSCLGRFYVLGPPVRSGELRHARDPCPLSVRHNCHWLPCSCEKRVRYIVYKVFDLGLRPLPPAPLSKFLGFRPLPPVSF